MEYITQVGEWFANAFVALWTAYGTWGLFGLGIIAPAVLIRVGNLVKKIFKF